jgi:hypothetical protein
MNKEVNRKPVGFVRVKGTVGLRGFPPCLVFIHGENFPYLSTPAAVIG